MFLLRQCTFPVVSPQGSVKVAKPLDYEDVRDYFLTVLARDGGLPALSNQASVNVSVTDYNDCPPVFGLPVYNAVVREDAGVGDRIIQVSGMTSDTIKGQVTFLWIGLLDSCCPRKQMCNNLERASQTF